MEKNSNDIKHIEKQLEGLEKKLRKHCTQNNLAETEAFLLMFNEEEGQNISYVKDMNMEQMGWTMNFYDKNSEYYDHEHDGIKWPYTGFIRGTEGQPISIHDLARWLKNSPYLEEPSPLRKNFIKYFEALI